jgi:hypothetical protein
MKTFHQEWIEQLIVAKSAAAVNKEKHRSSKVLISGIKIIFLQFFCFTFIFLCRNYDKNR